MWVAYKNPVPQHLKKLNQVGCDYCKKTYANDYPFIYYGLPEKQSLAYVMKHWQWEPLFHFCSSKCEEAAIKEKLIDHGYVKI